MNNIAEMFVAIQGEGILAGVPSVFIRTQGPAVGCTWCGSPRDGWTPDSFDLRLGSILASVRRHWCGYAVISGTEPLAAPYIEELAAGLREIEHHITIETSGSLYRDIECDLMSIAPVLTTAPKPKKKAAGPETPGYEIDAMRQLLERYPYQLKFAVSDRSEMEEVKMIADEMGADRTRVLLMPAGSKPKELRDQTEWIFEACRHFGYRFSPRLVPPAPPKKQA